MQQQGVKINNHDWDEQSTRISNLGFFGGVDPSNYTCQQFKKDLCQKIATITHKQPSKIPKFKCRYSSPFQFISVPNDSDRKISTKGYNLEVRQKDAKEMIKLIQLTYKDDMFIFHCTRHSHPEIYANAIRSQNKYLNMVQVVPIVGITRSEMFYLSNELLQDEGITMVLDHSKTEVIGCYSVITNVTYFQFLRGSPAT